jgi:hypothetical protein
VLDLLHHRAHFGDVVVLLLLDRRELRAVDLQLLFELLEARLAQLEGAVFSRQLFRHDLELGVYLGELFEGLDLLDNCQRDSPCEATCLPDLGITPEWVPR